MFLFNLLPFAIRSQPAPFLWVFYKALQDLGADVVFLLSADYLQPPSSFRNAGRQELNERFAHSMRYTLPSEEQVAAARREIIPEDVLETIRSEHDGNVNALFRRYLTSPIPALQSWFESTAERHARGPEPLEAIFTWSNCPSLALIAEKMGIPMIHCELGPLRAPSYVPTAYFDRSGVNGHTDCARRYADPANDLDWPGMTLEALRDLLRIAEPVSPVDGEGGRIGIALQVEADSNLIAFGRGEDAQSLINRVAASHPGQQMLVRSHPLSQFRYEGPLPVHDSRLPVEDFLAAVTEVVTINSSVAAEAVLAGIPARCFGDCAQQLICAAVAEDELARRLTFYFLAYLIPFQFLFQPSYIRFRLAAPSESEIAARHMAEHLRCRLEVERSMRTAAAEQARLGESRISEQLAQLSATRQHECEDLKQQVLVAEARIQHLQGECARWRASAEQLRVELERAIADHDLDRSQLRALLDMTETRLSLTRERLIRMTASRNHFKNLARST